MPKASRLLDVGIRTPQHWLEYEAALDELKGELPGVFGAYRRKNHHDMMVAAGAIRREVLCSYPVAAGSGTACSLAALYGLPNVSEKLGAELLCHLWHVFKKTSDMSNKQDSLSTLSLNLCGWHRFKQKNLYYNGERMDGLQRAIAMEEAEYLELLHLFREEGFDQSQP